MKEPTFLDIEQGSPEWLMIRKTRIAASDIPIILGLSPWCTPYKLWRQKLGFEPPLQETPSMRYGKDMEPFILGIVNDRLGKNFHPTVVFHADHDWRMASLDGYDKETGEVLEIKCANKDDHEKAIKKTIPAKYEPQLQWQLMCADKEKGYYASFNNGEISIVEVNYDPEYIKNILPKVATFYQCLVEMKEPAHHENDDTLRNLSRQLKFARGELAVAKKRVQDCEDAILEHLGESPEETDFLKVTKVSYTPSIDFKALLEDVIKKHPEIEEEFNKDDYLKRRKDSWRITPREDGDE